VATATAPDVTYEQLRALYQEASRHNWLEAVVLGSDDKPVTLRDLIVQRGNEARGRKQVQDDSDQQGTEDKPQGAMDKVAS
jgi:hypothetical protein